ncbi:phosphate transport system regulatory protein PhoU [marine gamma proteobacterium HTCC2207]|jgi:phosphate transport system protein|uniref:Phosphate-specific transport system accessory protein PhoU n=1 Tax=gamma proteobacterium HTCC2207 TaxID=314287 RepID=Q1YUJ4_9GAMM|nr:phosphate transport system regulatory protein PhoU [marine gamma proteobacterium HTCC2207] [gamma proteobacterium HTCC2207]MBT5106225.1 phosphate signaling complex protein PhoU [Porticoccaceae bacterium]MBT6114787.1 phosphate signaling complex protein PhoU [Porticoccaceae bacterium]MBT6593976.1 phosphate signaling complex protein PhoU [Porticoccaceae bacterium]MDB4426909.1 phosphate signaling complex protein PhoU [Porticoccaceae bacterium]
MDKMTFENHYMKQFDEELEEIRTRLMEMGGKVEQQLQNAIRAIGEADSKLAEEVIKEEQLVDNMEVDIDEACILIIARRQPAASDLRLVMMVTKAVNDLERIGDEAKKIANHALILANESGSSKGYTEVRHLGQSVISMLSNALDAFARFDVDAAMRTIEEDKQIDQEYKTALRELATYMMEDPRSISRVMNVLWVVRSLERIGDHAKNLCEQIVFVVKGKDIRHQK